jgi:thymidylate synthase
MTYQDNQYLDGLMYILEEGEEKGDRTGTGTISTFGLKLYFDLQEGFPLLTTKKIHWGSVINELIWFINGDNNVEWLKERGCRIWNEWALDDGTIGPGYGVQWRSWPAQDGCIDQLQDCIDTLMTNPNCRRNLVSAWNVGEIDNMALPPCHMMYQWYVREGKYLDCQMYQRSCDFFLGVPFNIASYSALIHIIARCTGLEPGTLHWVGGDCHIYSNHVDQVHTQLQRQPRTSPTLLISEDAPRTLDDWTKEHFTIEGYDPDPGIKGKVAV